MRTATLDGPGDHPTALTGIVGLGASAGGLEPLGRLLANVPAGSGLAFVVVQHLDPTQKAMLTELLQRKTAMPVREATSAMLIEPDVVYVIPPNSELTVANGALHVSQPTQPRGLRLPIDVLFSSLARDQGERAIGVVLSGMGTDGSLGLQTIKSQGGLTLVQTPESAQFDSMPQSAIDAVAPDIVALPADLATHVARIAKTRSREILRGSGTAADPSHPFGVILDLLHQRSRHDFTQYKPSTLKRRIERRMGVHSLETFADYESYLRTNPGELDLLFREMLIGVTSFFRDPAVWQELRDTALPALLAQRAAGEPLRAWVVGCSTGEEAYSLAIVFQEVVAHLGAGKRSLQIFATDLSADAIAVARKGYYSRTIADDLGPERLERCFRNEGEGLLIAKDIRDMVLFAQHDVILDPPFTKLDILSCRNVMIYFSAALQDRLLKLFYYAMRPDGVLVLGESETVGRSLRTFTPVHPKWRLYRRGNTVVGGGYADFPVNPRSSWRATTQESSVSTSSTGQLNLQALADQLMLREFSPAAVLVNEHGDVIYVSGHTARYLEAAAGKANWNIHAMARPAIRVPLAVALRQAALEKMPIKLRGLALEEPTPGIVDVTVHPVREPAALEGTILIVFHEVAPPGKRARRRPSGGVADPNLADELARSREEIRTLRAETRASAEALQAANEELQSTNEELQSANEELTTSKEESQSMNEELQTINGELRSKLDDLALAQSDMQNLLNSTDIATLFLDNDLNVRRFTERITRIIHLRDGDVGRPLSDLTSSLIYPDLHADAKETLRTLVFCEKQIPTTDGHWYSVRIMPYRTLANVIQGAVITFVDITSAKELEGRLRDASPIGVQLSPDASTAAARPARGK
jgi:two-component system CheB/CheR fusion protein